MLVDIPWLRGVDFLEPGTAITSQDLEAWEARTGVKVGSGDVLLIRTGRSDPLAREARQRNRWTFLLVGSPLRVRGGTGSPLNPLAVF